MFKFYKQDSLIFFRQIEVFLMTSNGEQQITLPFSSDQLSKCEQIIKQKQPNIRKVLEKRGSLKIKNNFKDPPNFNKEEIGIIETLSFYLDNVDKYIEKIDQFFQKKRIFYLCEIKTKLSPQQYIGFISTLQLHRVLQSSKLQEEGKSHSFNYIIVEGVIGAYREKKAKDQQKEYIQSFQYQTGQIILSNTLQTHKYNPYTVKAKKLSILLRFGEQSFTKYIKKSYLKDVDELSSMLCRTIPFRSICVNQMKKFIPYFSFRRYNYSDHVYSQKEIIKQLFLILYGEVQISFEADEDCAKARDSKKSLIPLLNTSQYKLHHSLNDRKQIKIVRKCKQQLFGLQSPDIFKENYYRHNVRVTSDGLKVLSIGLDVLYDMELQNPTLQDNLGVYLKKIATVHEQLLQKHQNTVTNAPPKKKKKKKKLKRKTEISLQWWGLAQKIQSGKKYRVPTPPHSQSQKKLQRKAPLQIQNRTSKLDYFKRRLFEDEMEELQQLQQQENEEPIYPQVLVPKLQKMKIKMISTKPKVVNNAERIKKKLMEYAKNTEVYCDKLQLE